MPYSTNIPRPDDVGRISQADILENFQEIRQVLAFDHEIFGSRREGKHKRLHLGQQPAGVFPDNALDINLLAINSVLSGNAPQLYMMRDLVTFPTGFRYPLSDGLTNADDVAPGWWYSPSGTMFKWGGLVMPVNPIGVAFVFSFHVNAATIPVFRTPPSIFLSNYDAVANNLKTQLVSNITTVGFTTFVNPVVGVNYLRYLAIGT